MRFFKYVTPLLLVFIFSCAGNLEKDIAKFDKYYGYCDNPHRNIRGIEYDICKEKERAAGPGGTAEDLEPFDIADFFSNRGKGGAGVMRPVVNPNLWQGALDATSDYSLKIADSTGGLIQTEWIQDGNIPGQRCMIKVQIVSADLVSNGVKTNFICEEKMNDQWTKINDDFVNEEKKLTLKILESAQLYSQNNT
jgi:hypothetical protein